MGSRLLGGNSSGDLGRAELAATPIFRVTSVAKRRKYEDDDDDLDDEDELPPLDGESRPYVHTGCGEGTVVSGGDYSHICNPFRICTGTFCCGCQGFVSLDSVVWADTGEKVSKFRARMRTLTPLPVKLWLWGPGLLPGAVVGAPIGLLLGFLFKWDMKGTILATLACAAVVGILVYLVIGAILKSVFGIDYTRTR